VASAPTVTNGYLVLEPGTANEEIILYTGVSGSNLTGCVRGLATTGSSESAGSGVSHAAGTRISMTVAHYYVTKMQAAFNAHEVLPEHSYRGSVADSAALSGISNKENGDLALTRDTNVLYRYNTSGGTWDALAAPVVPADASTTVKGLTKLSSAPASATNPIAVGDNDARVPTTGENDALVGTSGTPSSSNKYVTNDDTSATSSASKVVRGNGSGKIDTTWFGAVKYGGTGADGAFTATSGATNIDLGSARVVIKNYSSITITGSGQMTFTNGHANGTLIFILCSGAATITATNAIVGTNTGAAGGAGGSANGTGTDNGDTGSEGLMLFSKTNPGAGGTTSPGAGGAVPSFAYQTFSTAQWIALVNRYGNFILVGAGGGGGYANNAAAVGTVTGGDGGRGTGSIVIECAGAWNFTGSVNWSASNGGNGAAGGSAAYTGNGGGGGGAGSFVASWNTLISNAGTVSIAGGTGGNIAISGGGSDNGGGGGGGGYEAGDSGGGAVTDGNKNGGDGGDGVDYRFENTVWI